MTADKETKAEKEAAVEEAAAVAADEETRGYRRRTLGDGSTDFLCLFDQWTARDEMTMIEHVANFRARARNFVG